MKRLLLLGVWAMPVLALAAGWAAEEMPLQLAVRSPDDLRFKAAAEKQYLVFNLLGSGKVAFDKGDFASAANKWEALLRVPGLGSELDALVRPLAVAARQKAGGAPAELPPAATEPPGVTVPVKRAPVPVAVVGTLSGGGELGPGGAVVFLKRPDGTAPKPKQTTVHAVVQKNKRFVPRVLVVGVGSTVEFRNEDPLFHNVFSLSPSNEFDLGLYKGGTAKPQTFAAAGAVQLLCNIHSSMVGWVYVVDSAWAAQVDGAGKFTLKGVPPGDYVMSVWHERASKVLEKKVRISEGMNPLALSIDGDKPVPAFVPDKSGKPRQPQLGY